jgi:hypothetical protein
MGMSSYTNGSQSAGGGGGTMPASKRQRMTPEQMSALMDSVRHHIAVNPERYTQLVMRDMKEKYPELELNMGQVSRCEHPRVFFCGLLCSVVLVVYSSAALRLPLSTWHPSSSISCVTRQ